MSLDALKSLTISHPGVGWLEWRCLRCGESGPGILPEPHASEVCGDTKTAIVVPLPGYTDGGGI